MNKRQAMVLALEAITALVEVNLSGDADGDLFVGVPDNERDLQRFAAACEEICQSLANRAVRLKRSAR